MMSKSTHLKQKKYTGALGSGFTHTIVSGLTTIKSYE
jgi:hypothetical protein